MPHKTLNHDLIKEMVANYKNNQLQSIIESTTRPMPDDAHSIWFDLDNLKDFIADVEQLVAGSTNPPTGKLGIRMYYAAYPVKEKWSRPGYEDLAGLLNDPVTLQYEKKHTLIMVPTVGDKNGNADFNPLEDGDVAGRTIALTGTAAAPTIAMNHGFIIPPKSSYGEWF